MTGKKLVPGAMSARDETAAGSRNKTLGETTINGLRKFLTIWRETKPANDVVSLKEYSSQFHKALCNCKSPIAQHFMALVDNSRNQMLRKWTYTIA